MRCELHGRVACEWESLGKKLRLDHGDDVMAEPCITIGEAESA